MNHLTSSQIYPETLWEVPTPGFGTTESFNPRRRKLCAAAVVQQIYIEVCREFVTGFIEPPLCAGVSGSHIFVACVCFLSLCLAEIPVNELVTCISRLVPRYFCLPTVSYLLLRLLSFFFSPFCPCFLLSWLCLFTFTVDGNHRLRKMQPGTRLLSPFLRPFPFPFFFAEMQAAGHALGFQTSVCVGGPWRVTPP